MNGIVYLVSEMGNRGTFTKSLPNILIDFEFIYHLGYLVVSMLGLCVHEFFYSLLVSSCIHLMCKNFTYQYTVDLELKYVKVLLLCFHVAFIIFYAFPNLFNSCQSYIDSNICTMK